MTQVLTRPWLVTCLTFLNFPARVWSLTQVVTQVLTQSSTYVFVVTRVFVLICRLFLTRKFWHNFLAWHKLRRTVHLIGCLGFLPVPVTSVSCNVEPALTGPLPAPNSANSHVDPLKSEICGAYVGLYLTLLDFT